MINKIKEVVEKLNVFEAERLRSEGFTNECFFKPDGSLTDPQKVTFKEKKKYFYIDFGTSGAFMIDKETGLIYNIKAYGQINKSKCLGYIQSINDSSIINLHSKRHNYLK